MRLPIPTISDPALVSRRISVNAQDVVYVKAIVEASEGLACMFAERGGELLLVSSVSRRLELDEIVEDLRAELGAIVAA